MRLLHAGLTVTDLQESIAFYRDVVGMELRYEPLHTDGDWFGTLTENMGAEIDAVIMADDAFELQLVYYSKGGIKETRTGHNRVGNLHLCFRVDDVEAKHRKIVASGRWHPTPIVKLPFPGIRSFYVRDPDGVPVEFVEHRE